MTYDIPLRSQFFTNRERNTLMKEFEGIKKQDNRIELWLRKQKL